MTITPARVLLAVSTLSACAAQTRLAKQPTGYACEDARLVDDGLHLAVADSHDPGAAAVQLGWTDDAGRHYVSWPRAVTDAQSTEYVIPNDRRADAIVRRYDTRPGTAKQDWLLLHTSSCMVEGGYTDALTRFASGATMEDIRRALLLGDVAQARAPSSTTR